MTAWWIFLKERFEPISHIVLLSALSFAYGSLSLSMWGSSVPTSRWIICTLICFLFFFHLRLFDELKDYSYDIDHNPDRPLPRGLISLLRFKSVCVFTILLEILLAGLLGWTALLSLMLAVGYSLLMFKEFFIGNWLRSQLEIYAISHTFVAGLFIGFLFFGLSGAHFSAFPFSYLLAVGIGWMVFNIFEFARKSFAPQEERPLVETYSSRWGAKGASFLLWSFEAVLVALLFVLWNRHSGSQFFFWMCIGLCLATILSSLPYFFFPKILTARIMRAAYSLFLLLFHIGLGLTYFKQGYRVLL